MTGADQNRLMGQTAPATSTATQWVRYTPETATGLAGRIEEFEPVDKPAGHAAGRFLQNEALGNAGMTTTHLCISEARVEGFFSCCSASVRLSKRSVVSLGLRTEIQVMPAILITWVARHRCSTVTGFELMATAYGLAREASQTVAAAALVLDPKDEEVAKVWKAPPYFFQESEQSRRRAPSRLWLPLHPESEEAGEEST